MTAMIQSVLFTPVPPSLAYSSLGFHAAYQSLGSCERATLPRVEGSRARSVESGRVLSEFDCIYVSTAWELELPVLAAILRDCGIEPRRSDRPPTAPLVVAGGPQTLSNPDVLGSIADAVFVGEGDLAFGPLTRALDSAQGREDALDRLSRVPGTWVPAVREGQGPPPPEKAPVHVLPARSVLVDEPNQFGNAFLVEVGRGCPRECTFCVVRSGTRKTCFVPPERILEAVPQTVQRVGLVGAAVSDHPKLVEILESLVARGSAVTLSSLRADRATRDVIRLLRRGGLKTLTVAADGTSDALRADLRKGIQWEHLEKCVETAREEGMVKLRIYLMVGIPAETEDDIEECALFVRKLASRIRLSLSVSPFVPKRFTPLEKAPFAGIRTLKSRISLLRRLLRGSVKLKTVSPRTADSEWRLSHASSHGAWDLIEPLMPGP